jgi:RNA polymerase sigma-70 factor, ECF subfamily
MEDKTRLDTDKELIHRLRQGDQVASREWFKKYYSKLLQFALHKVSNKEDAEEIVQQTFINCLKHLAVFNEKSSILTWMKSIARHEIADFYRKKYAKKAVYSLPLLESLSSESLDDSSEVAKKVGLALKNMRKDYRELLLLKYVDGKRVKAVARELSRSLKSVEADLFRARKIFKEIYAKI